MLRGCVRCVSGRYSLPYMLNEWGLVDLAVEVGTHRGDYAAQFLAAWTGRRLFCVDPWDNPPGYEEQSKFLWGSGGVDREADYKECVAKLLGVDPNKQRHTLIKALSEEAAGRFKDASLDFVYVDADHTRPAVDNDLKLWWVKLRPGGVLAGHDFLLPNEPDGSWGRFIQPAVIEFAAVNGIDVFVLAEPENLPWSYYMIKPGGPPRPPARQEETKVDAAFPAGMVEEIDRFLQKYGRMPNGYDYYEEVFDTGLFFPLQRQQELGWMMDRAKSIMPATVMEIGADKAGGLFHWLKCLSSVKNLIACEIRGTPYDKAFERAFPHIKFMWMPHCSRTPDLRDDIKKRFGSIDCLFIDGDKDRFYEDFEHYLPLLAKNALVFMHDVQDPGPRAAFFKACCRPGWNGRMYIDVQDTIRAIKRDAEGVPPANAHEGWLRHWAGRSCGVGMLWREGGR